MQTKVLEIRDEGTCIAVIGIRTQPDNEIERAFLRRCGYPCEGEPNVLLAKLDGDGSPATNDPYGWNGYGARTFPTAHNWIIEHWDTLHDGDVIDVQFILGETHAPKSPEIRGSYDD